jgi:peptide/nickel transport system permease protein
MSLRRYVLKRLLVMIPVLIGASAVTFSLLHLIPGDPIQFMTAFMDVTPAQKEALRAQFGLNEPIYVQYVTWVIDAARFDFGRSIVTRQPVSAEILARLPYTLMMGAMAVAITLVTALPTGVVAAYYRDTKIDEASRVFALFGIAMPNFWLGLILILVFAGILGWYPVLPPVNEGLTSPQMIVYSILPAIALGTASTALLMRLMRSSMVEELEKDYVTMARAKGLPERTIVRKHVLKNSLISVVTVTALQVAFIISGAVVVETVFSYPGIGRLLVDRVTKRDFPVIQGLVLIIAVAVVVMNLLADVLYAYLDPRIRY